MNKDFETFNREVSWFNHRNEPIEFRENAANIETVDIEKIFPTLCELIKKSRRHQIEFKNDSYNLLTWDTIDGTTCGWLCKIENNGNFVIDISKEHELVLNCFGGIQESFNGPEGIELAGINYNYSFTLNQNFLFTKSYCEIGLGDYKDYYEELCKEGNCNIIDSEDYISFVREANGARTLYHRQTNNIVLFSHDHCFKYVDFIKGQPEYTFHSIKGVKCFVDYVEILAKQWTEHLEGKKGSR
jgi:hypothetical protein